MKAIIFDLDGVLVFTDRYHYLGWKKLADRLGIYFDEEINNRLRGVSRMDSLEIVLEKSTIQYSQAEKEKMAEEKNNTYRELLGEMTPGDVTEEVRSTLTKLREMGYKLAIGSSSKNTKFILEKVELGSYFDAISDGTNITKSKPDPEVFLKAAEFLGEDPAQCLVIEDAFAGVDAAKAGGMQAAGIGDASGYDKADYRLKSFCDILTLPCIAK